MKSTQTPTTPWNVEAQQCSSPHTMHATAFLYKLRSLMERVFAGGLGFGLRFICGLCVVCWLMGCGDGAPLGASCSNQAYCAAGLFCDQGAPGGYCTMACGESLPCPGNALCSTIEAATTSGTLTFVRRCLEACGVDQDCRSGYRCLLLPTGQQKVCFRR